MNRLERTVRRVDTLQKRNKALGFVVGVAKKYGDDHAGVLVANLAYSGFLAIFPLLLILVTILGIVLAGDPALQTSVLHSTFAQFPIIGTQLGKNIHALHRGSVLSFTFGLIGLTWGSLGVAQAALFAMAQVWNLPGPERLNYWKRLGRSVAFLGVLGGGLIVSTSLATFGTFGQHNIVLGIIGEVVAGLANITQYLIAFRVLTPKTVPMRDLVPGSIAGGVVWTMLLALGGYLIGHDLSHNSDIYGLFGIVLGLLAWVYLGARVSIYTAELNVVAARRLWPRSIAPPPLTEADRRALVLQAAQNQRRPDEQVTVSFTDLAAPPGHSS